jgi:drug/metabolite transporter (DMT)-like permease
VIMTMTPIIVLILSGIILKERIRKLQIIGVILGAIGSILFILLNENGGFASGRGDALILVNATSYSVYLVLVKPLMSKYKPLTVISWVFTFGLLYVIIWLPSSMEVSAMDWSAISSSEIAQILFVIVGVTFVPYLLNVFAMKKLSPSIAAVYIYLQPLMATGFVYLFFYLNIVDYRKDMSFEKVLCAIVVFIGVYLVIKPKKIKPAS